MNDFDAPVTAQIDEQRGTDIRLMVWIQARNRTTGATEKIGFWTGDDNHDFGFSGEVRTYFGAGDVFDFPPMQVKTGLVVQQYSFRLALTDAARQAMVVYDPRKARIEIHRTWLDLDTGLPLGTPERRFKGFIATVKRQRGAKGDTSFYEVFCETASRALTRKQPLLRSAAALHERNPADRFREYSDTAGDWTVPWGTRDVTSGADEASHPDDETGYDHRLDR